MALYGCDATLLSQCSQFVDIQAHYLPPSGLGIPETVKQGAFNIARYGMLNSGRHLKTNLVDEMAFLFWHCL